MKAKFRSHLVRGAALASIAGASLISGQAQAATCSLSSLASCNQTIGDWTFSGFSFSGFTESGADLFDLTTLSPANAQVQISWSPVRTSFPLTGSFSYTLSLAAGRTFDVGQANITGSFATLSTSVASSALTAAATSTNGAGSPVPFKPNLTTATFTQAFAYTGGTQFNSVGAAYLTTEQGTFTGTPGPLPLFGAGAAFGFSRKARRRIKAAA